METKRIQTSFHGSYLDLTAYPFYQNILKYFNDSQNQNFMTKVNPNNGSETKSDFKGYQGIFEGYIQGAYSNLALFSLVVKYWNIPMTFIIGNF